MSRHFPTKAFVFSCRNIHKVPKSRKKPPKTLHNPQTNRTFVRYTSMWDYLFQAICMGEVTAKHTPALAYLNQINKENQPLD